MPTTFKLIRYNPRRASRGAPAAEVEITSDELLATLWMSKSDIRKNLAECEEGDDASGLHEAMEAYKRGVAIDRLDPKGGE